MIRFPILAASLLLLSAAPAAAPTSQQGWKVSFRDPFVATEEALACLRVGPAELRCGPLAEVLQAQEEAFEIKRELERREAQQRHRWEARKDIRL